MFSWKQKIIKYVGQFKTFCSYPSYSDTNVENRFGNLSFFTAKKKLYILNLNAGLYYLIVSCSYFKFIHMNPVVHSLSPGAKYYHCPVRWAANWVEISCRELTITAHRPSVPSRSIWAIVNRKTDSCPLENVMRSPRLCGHKVHPQPITQTQTSF